MCGENGTLFETQRNKMGSSPRVRGKRTDRSIREAKGGLIPACAGKTEYRERRGRRPRAHPRVCGENTTPRRADSARIGSSPRVRGKLRDEHFASPEERLIPACAGKTSRLMRTTRTWWAHPRVCGENRMASSTACTPSGSSPRVRGKLELLDRHDETGGLIPACAGKTVNQSIPS